MVQNTRTTVEIEKYLDMELKELTSQALFCL